MKELKGSEARSARRTTAFPFLRRRGELFNAPFSPRIQTRGMKGHTRRSYLDRRVQSGESFNHAALKYLRFLRKGRAAAKAPRAAHLHRSVIAQRLMSDTRLDTSVRYSPLQPVGTSRARL